VLIITDYLEKSAPISNKAVKSLHDGEIVTENKTGEKCSKIPVFKIKTDNLLE